MAEKRIRILQVSTVDIGGGAEKVAWTLFKAYEALGYDSWLAAGRKYSHDAHVIEIPAPPQSAPWARLCWLLHGRFSRVSQLFTAAERICYWLRIIAQGTPAIKREIAKELGREDFDFPSTRDLLRLPPEKPDILHCHNLHGGYFDLRELPKLSRQLPTIITLHDEWLLSGHCAYTFTCNRWRSGCGSCPDVSIYPGIRRDATAYNWQCKKKNLRRKPSPFSSAEQMAHG
jgi:glycosyltransferase involved in cell wall biosynthesis